MSSLIGQSVISRFCAPAPLERLDLPKDPAHPDPGGYQAERRALQLTCRDKRRNDGIRSGRVGRRLTRNRRESFRLAVIVISAACVW